MNRKWTERNYHIQDNADVELKDVKMCCNTNQFPTLPFCGPHSKPHGARGLGKHYHLRFDPKLGMGKCEIRRIPCSCVACTSMLDKHGYLVYHQRNRNDTNQLLSALIGQY